ncbi:MAG: NAD(+)/NADH kinase [Elusimicrobia bacterium]|nr:NAD(+)/NADH kinase [Elusimicrobiota bacterium]
MNPTAGRSAGRVRTVAIVPNPEKSRARQELPRLKRWLKKRGIAAVGRAGISRSDAVITLGGDGTLLAVAPDAAAAGVPVIGVNLGRLGFMTAVELRRLYPSLDAWLKGRWVASERLLLEVWPPRRRGPLMALNDVVMRTGATSRITTVSLSISGERLGDFTGDGIIVATPTGSTAYSLAAQGPIVHPEMEALVVTPICAHSFRQRPIVCPADRALEVRLEDANAGSRTTLCLDGQQTFSLELGDRVRIGRAPIKLKLLQDPRWSYFAVLREKLSWGGR